MESGNVNMVRVSALETHSHSPLNKKIHHFSVPLCLISGPDQDLNSRFAFSIYPQRCLFPLHLCSCPGISFCVFGTTMHENLSLYSGGIDDLDQHPGCLCTGQRQFQIPCSHFEKKCCVKFKHKKRKRNTYHHLNYNRIFQSFNVKFYFLVQDVPYLI